ncbi:MAG: oligosaccharide flippase family protein [Bacteroidaceae bacterium]|nr:oligosaccharide flippase family protein [Bacteroidaceae bacterium]
MKQKVQNIIKILFSGSERTVLIKKNIMASSLLRVISIVISLMVVPATINYINSERYGIWLTLSSIIAWLSYFDFGFAHGFRNRFAEAVAKNEHILARKYVSTTYAVLTIIFTILMIITSIANNYINWSSVLNVDPGLNIELKSVFRILILFFCINIVAEVFSTMLIASQRPAASTAIKTIGNFLSLIAIIILTYTTKGSLEYLAIAFSGIPCLLTIIVSIIVFCKGKYKKYAPSFSLIDFSLTKKIVGMGGQFFLIMLCLLFIFQFTNIIISRELGPESVTIYNVTYKLFHIIEMVVMIVLSPIWSAYTDAYTHKDYGWMKRCSVKLEKMGLFSLSALTLLTIISPFVFSVWLGDNVNTSIQISIAIAFFTFCKIMGAIYMHQLNGIGKVRIQLITYIVIAVFAIPVMIYSCRQWGLVGIVIVPSIAFFAQFIICRIQLKKIINQTATGIWNK